MDMTGTPEFIGALVICVIATAWLLLGDHHE